MGFFFHYSIIRINLMNNFKTTIHIEYFYYLCESPVKTLSSSKRRRPWWWYRLTEKRKSPLEALQSLLNVCVEDATNDNRWTPIVAFLAHHIKEMQDMTPLIIRARMAHLSTHPFIKAMMCNTSQSEKDPASKVFGGQNEPWMRVQWMWFYGNLNEAVKNEQLMKGLSQFTKNWDVEIAE